MTTALAMLHEVTELNGCLYFIPGSQRHGYIESEMHDRTTSYRLWVVPKADLLRIMADSPEPVSILGQPGTVVFFHCNILHASGHNTRGTTAGTCTRCTTGAATRRARCRRRGRSTCARCRTRRW
jgi:ectoine hydroxylase-related dioxygenase (phytanoyl-CoA dioxygenase family)